MLTAPQPARSLEEAVRERLAECPYRHCFSQISWSFESGTLVLKGRVPSFYLKQVLQTLLRDLECVEHIDNQVDVVSSTGLSTPAAS